MSTPASGGIKRPQIPPRASTGISDAMVQDINPSAVLRRWGIIRNVNSNGTVDVNVAGSDVLNVKRLASYNPSKDERVQIDVVGTDMVVIGATAPSPKNSNLRTATVTAIATNGTLSLQFDDGSTLASVTRLATYNPIVNDVVQVEQSGNGGVYVVVGPVMYSAAATQQAFLRRPTGDIEMTIRKTAKPGTLILDGAFVSRTDYPNLFKWVQDQGLLTTPTALNNLFGAGNGTTTFQLPDFRGRVPVGAGALLLNGVTDTYVVGDKQGTNRVTVTSANLPNHTHTITDHPGHTHTGTAASQGSHFHEINSATGDNGSHYHGMARVAYTQTGNNDAPHWHSGRTGYVAEGANPGGTDGADILTKDVGGHTHSINTDTGTTGAHTHTVTANANTAQTHTVQSSGGSAAPAAIDTRAPSFALNYLVWV